MPTLPKKIMKFYITIAIVSGVIIFSSILWYQTYNKSDSVDFDPAMLHEMENYFKQKLCTQIMIDQSNGHNIELPEDCPAH